MYTIVVELKKIDLAQLLEHYFSVEELNLVFATNALMTQT